MLGSMVKFVDRFDASACCVFAAMDSLCDAESPMKNGLFALVSSKFSNVYPWRMIRVDSMPA
jgi:hypothetical protein